jgi:hypothetical protein
VPRSAAASVQREMESLLAALRQWAKENPEHLEASADDGDEDAGRSSPGGSSATVPPWAELIDEIFAPEEEEEEPEAGLEEVLLEPLWGPHD